MDKLELRSKNREQLVKLAQDSVVNRAAKLFLSQYRSDLEHLEAGDQVSSHIPIGKDRFIDWVKNILNQFFPQVSGVIDNEKILKEYAVQIADAIAKSNTNVQDPLRDYEISKDPIYIKAGVQVMIKKLAEYPKSPAQEKVKNIYDAPTEHSRYCPEHRTMLTRKKDKEYFCQEGNHDVKFETGVQNQTHPNWNDMHPIFPFLSTQKTRDDMLTPKGKEYGYEHEDLYGVESPELKRQSLEEHKEAELLNKITRKAQEVSPTIEDFSKEDVREYSYKFDKEFGTEIKALKTFIKGIEEKIKIYDPTPAERRDFESFSNQFNILVKDVENLPIQETTGRIRISSFTRTAKYDEQIYAPTTMIGRQCPDHAGQQLSRISDNVRQCPLDKKIYDFSVGFTTEDGKKHNGGTVEAQNCLPPGTIIVKKQAAVQAGDSQRVHKLLFEVRDLLPAGIQRDILNKKFQNNISLDQAIGQYEQFQIEQAQQKAQNEQQPTPPTPLVNASGIKSFVKESKKKDSKKPKIPKKVKEIAKAIEKDKKSPEVAHKMAWETYCSYVNPKYEGCTEKGKSKRKSPKSEY